MTQISRQSLIMRKRRNYITKGFYKLSPKYSFANNTEKSSVSETSSIFWVLLYGVKGISESGEVSVRVRKYCRMTRCQKGIASNFFFFFCCIWQEFITKDHSGLARSTKNVKCGVLCTGSTREKPIASKIDWKFAWLRICTVVRHRVGNIKNNTPSRCNWHSNLQSLGSNCKSVKLL